MGEISMIREQNLEIRSQKSESEAESKLAEVKKLEVYCAVINFEFT